MVLIIKMVAINKHSRRLKDRSVEMPNAPYSSRCMLITALDYIKNRTLIII
jgi:hypothetical protein